MSTIRAQTVEVELLEEGSGAPVVGAMVALVDSAGAAIAPDLTDSVGAARLRASGSGTWRLRAERIGYHTVLSSPFDLAADETRAVRLRLPLQPVELEALRVEVDAVCRSDRSGTRPAALLWDEARKALERVVWSRARSRYAFDLVLHERRLDRRGRIEDEETRDLTVTSLRAFDTAPAELLAERGFIQAEEGDTLYFGPDAEVLLSDAFARAHCFYSDAGEDRRVGLAFEPLDPDLSDIAGTLWLDQETAALLEIDFHYTGPIAEAVDHPHEGRITFRDLPDGGWIVGAWWIRLPVYTQSLGWTSVEGPVIRMRRRLRLSGYVEWGGTVERVRRVE